MVLNSRLRVWAFVMAGLLLCVMALPTMAAKPAGLLAQWNFNDGQGDVAADSSGNGHDAKLYGATWVKQADGFAINLDGRDDYLDCGDSRAIGITGPITIEAWIKPARETPDNAVLLGENLGSYLLTYYNKSVCWYIGHKTASNHLATTAIVKKWSHLTAIFDNDKLAIWINGRQVASRKSAVKIYKPDAHFMIATKGRPDLPHYKGLIDQLRIYNRGLTRKEITAHFKAEAPNYGFDPTWFKRLKVTPYYYLDRGEIVIEADYKGLQPLTGKGRLEVTLSSKNKPNQIIDRQVIDAVRSKAGVEQITLPCSDLKDGDYIIRLTLQDSQGAKPTEELAFSYPARPVPVISPAKKIVAPQPPTRKPTPFGVKVGQGGGFTIAIKDRSYRFQSRISWPNGDFNWLTADDHPSDKSEATWKTSARPAGHNSYEVKAGGDFYNIHRQIEVYPTHVYVKDKYTNITDKDLGLLIYNETPIKSGQVVESLLSGLDKRGRQREGRVADWSPSAFFTDTNNGMGMVPMDDVFVIQVIPYIDWQDAAGLCTEKFALAPQQSYTLEWAVYPTGSGDYYDFINNFRKVEDRIGTIHGGASFISFNPDRRRQVPSRDFIDKQNMKVGIISGLAGAADDPQVSIQGLEFMDFPKEMELLKWQAASIHQRLPGFKVVFHIAHSIYTTDNPQRFADSRVIDSNGKQVVWKYGYDYISKERQDKGWQGWIFYPMPGNSFHDALMESADIVMNDIGMDGVFMDGFFSGMISRWTFDRWDGHSALIDLQTKTIKRKMASVLLLSQPSMIAFARKIHNKGGTVIANNAVITRSIANEKYLLHDIEAGSGPQLHLAPTLTALGRGSGGEKGLYLDVLETLKWGELYTGYYVPRMAGHDLTRPLMTAKQFPMTFQEIRSGLVKGKQRIVTMNSGIYGWSGNRDLHMVYKYDARGALVAHDFVTTIDTAGVRTELKFQENESAVIVPIPLTIEAQTPVNVRVLQYDYRNDNETFKILLNGQSEVVLNVFVGSSYFSRRDTYQVTRGKETTTVTEKGGMLSIPLNLTGQIQVVIKPTERGK